MANHDHGPGSSPNYSFNMRDLPKHGFARPYKSCTLDEEVLYSARVNLRGSLELTKWDGHKRPIEVYTITQRGHGKCDCQGSSRNPYCKHRKMVDAWSKITATSPAFVGEFYNNDTGTLYTPADGEGIPLSGVIDLGSIYAHA